MDRRTHLRMDQPQPPSDARLRALRKNRRRLRPPRHDPHHAQTLDQTKPLLMNPFFLDRLLGLATAVLPSLRLVRDPEGVSRFADFELALVGLFEPEQAWQPATR